MFTKLFNELTKLETFSDKDEIGLCYDLMIGAAYSLKNISDKYRFDKPEIFYDHEKRKELMRNISENQNTTSDIQKWADGYYFANAGHRIVWTEERLNNILWNCPACSNEMKNNRKFNYNCYVTTVNLHLEDKHGIQKRLIGKIWKRIYPKNPTISSKIREVFNKQKHDPSGLYIEKIQNIFGNENVLDIIQEGFFEVIRLYKFTFLLSKNKTFKEDDLKHF